MTHRERFLFERWKEKRAAKNRAKALARKGRKLDPKAKTTEGFWPGMYEGVPRPTKIKPIYYQERAVKSVGFLKGVTKNTHNLVKKSGPIAPHNSNSSTQGPSERHAGHHQACSMSDVRTPTVPVNTPVRETQKLSAVLYDPNPVGQDN